MVFIYKLFTISYETKISRSCNFYRPHPKNDGRLYFHFVCQFTPGGGGVPTFRMVEGGYLLSGLDGRGGGVPTFPGLGGGRGVPTFWVGGRYPRTGVSPSQERIQPPLLPTSERLLATRGRYASCGQAGGLSCKYCDKIIHLPHSGFLFKNWEVFVCVPNASVKVNLGTQEGGRGSLPEMLTDRHLWKQYFPSSSCGR